MSPKYLFVGGELDGQWRRLGRYETPPEGYRRIVLPREQVIFAHENLTDQGAVI